MVISVLSCPNGRSNENHYDFYDLPFPGGLALLVLTKARRGWLEPADAINTCSCQDLARMMTRI